MAKIKRLFLGVRFVCYCCEPQKLSGTLKNDCQNKPFYTLNTLHSKMFDTDYNNIVFFGGVPRSKTALQ